MFETLTITLREGIEAALVIGIILAYLAKTNKQALKKYVYAGIIAAVAGSIATAIAIQMLLAEWSEFMEGLMFFIAAFFIGTMLLWMHRASRHIKQDIEQGVEGAFNKWQALGVLALTFFMIYREGAEIVLFLSATAKEASTGTALEGGAGLALAAVFGYLFIKGSLRMDLGRFFKITGAMLAVIIFQLIVGGIHEWSEVGIITLGPMGMRIIGPLVKDPASVVFTGIMLFFLLLLFMLVPWKAGGTEGLQGIERRKALGAARRERARKIALGLSSIVLILVFTGYQISALGASYDPVPEKVSPENGTVKIKLSSAGDGALHKYVCDMKGDMKDCPMHGPQGDANVRVLAIKRGDGSVAVAYDACILCGDAGYVQEGENVICKRCGAPINIDTIGLGGGCNPIVLPYSAEGDEIAMKISDLGSRASLFTR